MPWHHQPPAQTAPPARPTTRPSRGRRRARNPWPGERPHPAPRPAAATAASAWLCWLSPPRSSWSCSTPPSGIGLLALLIAIATIRVSRQELAGAVPAPQEAAPQPGTVQRHEDRAALAAAARPCRFC